MLPFSAHTTTKCPMGTQFNAQAVAHLADGSGLVFTVMEVKSPSGRSWSGGLQPTRVIPRMHMNDYLQHKIRHTQHANGSHEWSLQ